MSARWLVLLAILPGFDRLLAGLSVPEERPVARSATVESWTPASLRDMALGCDFFGSVTVVAMHETSDDRPGSVTLAIDETLLGDTGVSQIRVAYWRHFYSIGYTHAVEVGDRFLAGIELDPDLGQLPAVWGYRSADHLAAFRRACEAWRAVPDGTGPARDRAEFEWLIAMLEDPALRKDALVELLPEVYTRVSWRDDAPRPALFRTALSSVPASTWDRIGQNLSPRQSHGAGYTWTLWYRADPLRAAQWLQQQPGRSEAAWTEGRIFAPARMFWARVADALPPDFEQAIDSAAWGVQVALRPRDGSEPDPAAAAAALHRLEHTVDRIPRGYGSPRR